MLGLPHNHANSVEVLSAATRGLFIRPITNLHPNSNPADKENETFHLKSNYAQFEIQHNFPKYCITYD